MNQSENLNTDIAVRISRVLERSPFIPFAVLFGSLAKGCARPESDLDLAVEGIICLVFMKKWR